MKKICVDRTSASRAPGALNTVYLSDSFVLQTQQWLCVAVISYVRVSGLAGPNPVSAAVAQSHISAVVNTTAHLQEFLTGNIEYVERDIPGHNQGPAGLYFIDDTSVVAARIDFARPS